jgi:cell division septal protein FtsQ
MKNLQRNRAIAIAVVVFSALVYLFAWSPVFQVKAIEVQGLPESVQPSFIVAAANIQVGEKLSRVEPRSISNRLKALDWVKSSDISRNWFSGRVAINVVPRTPVGIFEGKALDSSGTLFSYPGKLPQNLPVVSASTPELGLTAIALFRALPTDVRDSLVSINAHNQSSLSSWQRVEQKEIKVEWGSVTQIPLKVQVYKALLALPENANVKRVDLSAPHAPIVK